jgi:hypothetical protein
MSTDPKQSLSPNETAKDDARDARKRKCRRRMLFVLPGLIAFLCVAHVKFTEQIEAMSNRGIQFGSEIDERETPNSKEKKSEEPLDDSEFAELPAVSPFEEIVAFDEMADDWTTIFDGFQNNGVLVFDANGDDLMDVYLCANGAGWTRPTDENAVIKGQPFHQHNVLYLNRGNDAEGRPIFENSSRIDAATNAENAEAELLIENFLFPRKSPADPIDRPGRIAAVATAADLNADGRPDLIVGNALPGMLWSHEKTQRVLNQFVRPVGREAVHTKLPLRAQGLYFLKDYQAGDQIDDLHNSARGEEPIGSNSIFLNLGDSDGDGLPEWRDATSETGLGGKRSTMAMLVSDIDLDGDLDVFESNVMDMDFFPGGATELAGAANQIYINQLADSGELRFIERGHEMNVDGIYDDENPMPDYHRLYKIPVLPKQYSVPLFRWEAYHPEWLEINGETSEPAEISWASVFQDVNGDHYPDLWVANDMGYLRLYINEKGESFRRADDHPRGDQSGYWMTLTPADFDGDLKEDLFAGNAGGSAMNIALANPDPYMLFKPVISTGLFAQHWVGHHSSLHMFIDGSDHRNIIDNKIRHSAVLPPDAALPNNIREFLADKVDFDRNSLDACEFAWGSTAIDVQNDSRPDLYWIGCLYGRGGSVFPIMGTGPGRLLVNAKHDGKDQPLRFVDLTAEHHVLNIAELQYDRLESEGIIWRNSPLQNWSKRSVVTSQDVSVWGMQGEDIAGRVTNRDLIQASENGRTAVAADLNGDGFSDLIVRNAGGYDSRSSKSKNLKAKINGEVHVTPSHDANFPSPTNFEPGSTRTFLNTYGRAENAHGWIKIDLVDDTPGALNRDAVGAKVVINGRLLQVRRAGNGGFGSNCYGPMLFGLGEDSATTIEVTWPAKGAPVSKVEVEEFRNGTLTISRSKGTVAWKPAINTVTSKLSAVAR